MLTAVKLRNAKARKRPYKLADGGGMYLMVNPTGAMYWRLKYRIAGTEKVLALGVFRGSDGTEQMSLAEARDRRDDAKRQMRDGQDPGLEKRKRKREVKIAAGSTFELVAKEWVKKEATEWDPAHTKRIETSLQKYAYPTLGSRPLAQIEPSEVAALLERLELRGAHETRSRVQQRISAVFRHGVKKSYCRSDPTRDLRGAFATQKVVHRAALSEQELPEFYERLSKYVEQGGERRTQLAIRFLALTMVRTGELRGAEWGEFDIEGKLWKVPASRMKMKIEHAVPLSNQVLEILAELREMADGSPYVFPQTRNARKPMSENAVLFALYRMGYHSRATGHGFRTTASTILNEAGWNPDAIEAQLAHQEPNAIRRAYNRARYLGERKEMMQSWADLLDAYATPKAQRKIIPGKFGAKRAKA